MEAGKVAGDFPPSNVLTLILLAFVCTVNEKWMTRVL